MACSIQYRSLRLKVERENIETDVQEKKMIKYNVTNVNIDKTTKCKKVTKQLRKQLYSVKEQIVFSNYYRNKSYQAF